MLKILTLLCFTIAVGRNASADGTVLLGHNEDDYNVTELYLNSTAQGLWAQVPGLKAADCFLNRWGVSIVSDNCRSREDREDWTDGGVLYEVRYNVYQQARSAQDAVRIIGDIVERLGYNGSGRSYIVADSREAWVVSVVQGRHWVAQRVPDDEVMLIPNYYVIGRVDPSDRKNFRACPGLVEYAVERGWYDPDKDGEFSFRDAFAQRASLTRQHNLKRHADVLALMGIAYNPSAVPFSVKHVAKLGVEDVEALLQPVYVESTIYSLVFQMKRRKPVMWFCSTRKGDNRYRPIVLGAAERRDTVKVEDILLKVNPPESDATEAIQSRLDRCFLAGGGKVILTKGIYKVGGLRLRSNTTLYLQSGAVLQGSRNCDDYYIMYKDTLERLEPEDSCGRDVVWIRPKLRKDGKAYHITYAGSRWNDAIIRIYKADNAAVIGEPGSVIDGCNSYDVEGEEHYRGVHGISAHKSRNLTFRGYTIRNTGNWAHLMRNCVNVTYDKLEILAGHDGVHVSTCDSIRITDCVMKTGDDCVAGFDNSWVWVNGCTFNTACSAFRFGGTHVYVDNCLCYGPGQYPIRGSLSPEEKESGAMGDNNGRRNMLSVFTYYADKTLPIRARPGDIRFSNLTCKNIDRFLHYNLSGNETWQLGTPLDAVSFENVTAKGIKLPLCAYAALPFTLSLIDCSISFEEPVPEVIRGAYLEKIYIRGLTVEGADDAPLVRSWEGDEPLLDIDGLNGAKAETVPADRPFKVKSI